MFRHLEILRSKKKAELAPSEPVLAEQVNEKPDVEDEVDHRRRRFLRGLGAAAAVAAMPAVLHTTDALAGKSDSLDPIMRRERAIDEGIASFKQALKSPELQNARRGIGAVIEPMLHSLRRFDAKNTFGTKYDCSAAFKRYAVQFVYGKNKEKKTVIDFIPASAGPDKYMRESPGYGYGNGFYWGRKDLYMTAQHLIEMAQDKPDSRKPYDIGFIKMPTKYHARPEQIVYDDTTITDADIDGEYVSILGIDNDETAMKDGSVIGGKIMSGGAVRLTREWVDVAFANASPAFKERLYRSFMVELPPGEAAGATADVRPISGVSGGLVLMKKDGKETFAGIFHSAYFTPEGQSLAFFYGPEAARHQFAAYTRSVA